jgi:Sec7-like guanine-nucleotide exchange factor
MKSQGLPSAKFSTALLTSRYLALQELRQKVRRAEERLASPRSNKAAILQSASRAGRRSASETTKIAT